MRFLADENVPGDAVAELVRVGRWRDRACGVVDVWCCSRSHFLGQLMRFVVLTFKVMRERSSGRIAFHWL